MAIITLTTDFGLKDAYVASMKGVILGKNPDAKIVDISHEIYPQDIKQATLVLSAAYPYFPEGSIHVVVVDPGVGSDRRILCLKTKKAIFLAPDNGILAPIIEREKDAVLRVVQNERFFLKSVSATFHGRDLFAPVAAHLSTAQVFKDLGPLATGYERHGYPDPVLRQDVIEGEIIYIDRFGNLISNIEISHFGHRKVPPCDVTLGKHKIERSVTYYAEAKKDEIVALINSSGYVEIALRDGSARNKTRAKMGTKLTMHW